MIFDDILEIKNGRNQKNVENPNGKYPIYGSGGIMGYADDYICEADTVIIGRKGSINNPIYVEEPFWNVDTAFGLSAKREILMPRYLYYFCQYFDFERLNKAVKFTRFVCIMQWIGALVAFMMIVVYAITK